MELTPQAPVNRVGAESLRLYGSMDGFGYLEISDWTMRKKENGLLEIVLDMPTEARFLKVHSLYDERDEDFNPVNKSEFYNLPQELIRVYYQVKTRIEEYAYDVAGNRRTETVTLRSPVTKEYTYYPNSNRLQTIKGRLAFEYDANGNLIKKGSCYRVVGDEVIFDPEGSDYWEYEYDLLNRLTKVIKNGETVAEYLYDEAGYRLKKTGKGSEIYYVFSTDGQILYEEEAGEYTEYVYVLGKHFARVDGDLSAGKRATYFYHTDHLGSTVLVTDEAGNTVWSSEYTPFGQITMEEGTLAKAAKFTGKDLDEDTGLYYFNARWYDQSIGRFISEDPIKDGVNWYTYAANNPLRFVDPTGKTYEDFEKEAKSRIEQHNQNAIIFSALKGSTFESAVETNISYRDHLAQSAGGTEVAKAQAALKMAGYDLGSYGTQGDGIDGVKGGKTTKAIRHFQHAVGLEPTGNLDPKTIAALDLAVQAGFTKVQLVELGKVLGHGGLVRVNMPLPKDSKRYKEFTPFLDASVAYKFNAFVEDCQKAGIPLVVSEGFRTFAYQEFLYNTDPDAAKPGTSPHESGLAFDLDWKPLTKGQQAALLDIAKAHGFLQTVMPREPWHFGIKADWNYYQFKREYNSQDWLENSKYLTNRGDKYNE